jgi:hypothetical protein
MLNPIKFLFMLIDALIQKFNEYLILCADNPMDAALAELRENLESNDTMEICRLLDNIIYQAASLSNEQLAAYHIDSTMKIVLKRNMCIQILEKIPDLLVIIRDPRNLYDELMEYMNHANLILPTLMLMYQLRQSFDFEYDLFYNKLEEVLTTANAESEGFLLFMLRCLEDKQIDISIIRRILKKLSFLSIEVLSDSCIRIAYCILVIMRMHPASFKHLEELKELNILLYSLESIKNIVKRIFIEASNASKRPKIVFLQNFIFPDLIK